LSTTYVDVNWSTGFLGSIWDGDVGDYFDITPVPSVEVGTATKAGYIKRPSEYTRINDYKSYT